MSRRPVALAAAFAVLGTLTACAPDPVDPAQIAQWRSDRQAEIDADGPFLAVLSSDASMGRESDRMESKFDQQQLPTAVTFDCFGDGDLELALDSASTTGTATTTETTIRTITCGDGTHEIDSASLGTDPINLVGVTISDADRDTAWFLTVRGVQSAP